ncbi:MAG: acyl-CoA dehydrogenase family protein [Anaerolineae bacterium]
MNFDLLLSPTALLDHFMPGEVPADLRAYEAWMDEHGRAISAAVDRAGTPWVKQFDRFGSRIGNPVPPEYWTMLCMGYKAGAVWRAQESLSSAYRVGYVTSFFDMGLYCPYTVSLGTAAAISNMPRPTCTSSSCRVDGSHRLRRQGATWMTEARGGSDLGATVETVAHRDGDRWLLTGDKYFCSNAGAELAVVAARPDDAQPGVRGLALFLVPRLRVDGSLNYTVRRLKDKIATRSVPTGEIELRGSEAYLLGEPGHGIYHILEVLNLSRVANCIGSAALMQRALADAFTFARAREIFGRKLIDQPLMRRQFERKAAALESVFKLTWEVVRLADEVWREPAPRYSERFQLFRVLLHLAKYWTAEQAVQAAKWSMEVNGGMGTLAEFGVERHLREAMIADIWEGPPHRQILDGVEAMERKGAHRLLFDYLAPKADVTALADMRARVEALLALPQDEKEAASGDLFHDLAAFAAATV